jgi:hypothetical protein
MSETASHPGFGSSPAGVEHAHAGTGAKRIVSFRPDASVKPRALLIFLLVSGALMLSLTAAVDRPSGVEHTSTGEAGGHESTTTTAPAANGSEGTEAEANAGEEQTTEAGTGESPSNAGHEAHATAAGATTAESDPVVGESEPTPRSNPVSMFGIRLDSLHLRSPRLVVTLVALTTVAAIAYSFAPSGALLALVICLGVFGTVVGGREGANAGEELGIFVPLPILAAILYAAAVALGTLRIVTLASNGITALDDV